MKYLMLVELYEKIVSTSKSLEKTYYLSQFLKKVPADDLDKIVLLIQGKVFPIWSDRKIGVASRLVLKSISLATGIKQDDVEKEWKKVGDLGLVSENLIHKKKQATLFSHELTVSKVFDNIVKLSVLEGEGTVDKKVKLIAELLTSAKPIEAKYITRTVLEDLRVGVGDGSVRDAISWGFLPIIPGIFFKCSCGSWIPKAEKCLECNEPLNTKFKDQISSFKPTSKTLKIQKIEDLTSVYNKISDYDFILAVEESVARLAYNYLVSQVQESFDVTNDFSSVALTLKTKGLKGLSETELSVGRPVKVMLAIKAQNVSEGFERVGRPADLEFKLDGFRMQIHKKNDVVSMFTRRLENVTEQFPDVVNYIKKNIKADNCILDAEAVGTDPKTGKYRPFQEISQRIKRKYDIDKLRNELPVELNVFDILFLEGKSLIKLPFVERRKILEKIVKDSPGEIVVVKNCITDKDSAALVFYQLSLKKGNEGIMFKNLQGIYKPGSRVGHMVKLKPTMETLDLVITGAEWGEGKRTSWLTSFTLACTDENGDFLDIGQVGTGFKEKEESGGITFEELTNILKPLIISEKGKVVKVKPKVVLEVKFEEIQKSTNYKSGYALRFPRVIRMRLDRSFSEISDLNLIEQSFVGQKKNKRVN